MSDKNSEDEKPIEDKVEIDHKDHDDHEHHRHITEAANVALAIAEIKGRLNPLSRESFLLYGCAVLSFLCSMANGYDGSLMTGLNGMPYWKATFNGGDSAPSTGIIFAIYTVGQMVGSLWADKVVDRFGRRAGMWTGCLIVIVGTIVATTSHAKGQFIAGRFILGMGITVATVSAPMYCIEIAPPQWRGRMTALYNTGWNGGSIPAAAVVFKTQAWQSNWSWKVPLIIQCIPSGVVVCIAFFFPESPRWLYAHGREAEAVAFLTKYHGNGDPENPVVRLEIEEFHESIKLDATDKRWWDYSALYKTHSGRWRFLMVFLMGFFGQMSGNGLGYYNLSIYEALGFDTYMQFAMNLISSGVAAVTAWTATALSDKMPRRRVLVIGTFVCCVMLGLNAGLSAKWASYGDGPKNLNVGKLGAAFYFLFNAAYGFTYTPLQALYVVECLETTARGKGASMQFFVIACTSFINLYCIPIGLANIQWRFMLVYVFWDAFETVIWYFFAVETLGRTLEELEEVFNAPYPVKASLKMKKLAVDGDNVIVVDDDSDVV